MKVEIMIDDRCKERKVVIYSEKLDSEITKLYNTLSGKEEKKTETMTMFDENGAVFSDVSDIYRIYSQQGKVFAQTAEGVFQVRARMYEIEQALDGRVFVRISNSEIINLRRVKRMDTSLTGTICVTMKDGSQLYASRRYVSQIRKMLDI